MNYDYLWLFTNLGDVVWTPPYCSAKRSLTCIEYGKLVRVIIDKIISQTGGKCRDGCFGAIECSLVQVILINDEGRLTVIDRGLISSYFGTITEREREKKRAICLINLELPIANLTRKATLEFICVYILGKKLDEKKNNKMLYWKEKFVTWNHIISWNYIKWITYTHTQHKLETSDQM